MPGVGPSAKTTPADLEFEDFEGIDPLSEVTAALRSAPPPPRTSNLAESRDGTRRDKWHEPFPLHQTDVGSRPSPPKQRTTLPETTASKPQPPQRRNYPAHG